MRVRPLTINGLTLQPVHPGIWRIDPFGRMRVGVHLIGSPELLQRLEGDRSLEQATRVAQLPGVVDPVLTMPDIHQGYGFPIGGVAAFRESGGVVSPGGVGYDINCGIRLLTTDLPREKLEDGARACLGDLFDAIPAGVGSRRQDLDLSEPELEELLSTGVRWARARGFASATDEERIEERGCLPMADPDCVTPRAKARGMGQLGTLGSGNHFVEIGFVDDIYDEECAEAYGLFRGQVTVAIHTGSRGLGYQVCSDSLEEALASSSRYGIDLPERELAAAPLDSAEGQRYLKAMAAAANFAFVNRQIITHWTRGIFKKRFGVEMELLYDVCHNIAKFEELPIGGTQLRVCVHRKGATRAYPPKHPAVSPRYREVGQPVLVPGDMGRYSFVLAGRKGSLEKSLGSACHGAGRELSRAQAKKRARGRAVERELSEKGIYVKSAGHNTVREEMPEAYKDVAEVVSATEAAGIASCVAKLKPIAVVKG